MIKLTYKTMLFLLLGFVTTVSAETSDFKKEFTREVHESFNVSSGVDFSVQNRHGDINIATWGKSEIEIDVLIKVKSNNSEKAQQFLNEIEIAFDASSSRVSAETIIPNNDKPWWSGWFGNNKNLNYEVHYTINAPESMSTHLINKYGNIKQASINGDCEVTNKYGDVFLEDVSGRLDLNLGYGKASIGSVGDSEMQVKYSSVKLVDAGDMRMSTKYSDFKIKSCGDMTAYTKYDDYRIGEMTSLKNDGKYDEFTIQTINDINIDTKYTDVDIQQLNGTGIFDTAYGSVDVSSTGSNLEKIRINSKYTDYKFGIDGDFNLDFEGSRTDLHVSKPYEKYSSHKDGGDLKIGAYRGSKGGGAQISAYMRYGGLKIM